MQSWCNKYSPNCLKDILITQKNKKIIKDWMISYKKDPRNTKKILLLSGPPGTGKSSLANILLKEFGYRIIEYNASELKGAKSIQEVLTNTLTYRNVVNMFKCNNSPVGVILDEIDTLSDSKGSGKNGLKYLLDLVKKNDKTVKRNKSKKDKTTELMNIKSPIICTYNEFKDKKLTILKKYSVHINIKKIPNMLLGTVIDKIAKNEGFSIEFDAKIILMNHAMGDIRRLINLLYYIFVKNKNNITLEDVEIIIKSFKEKDVKMELYESTKYFLNNKINIDESLKLYFEDTMLLPLMVHDNFHKVILTRKKINANDVKSLVVILDNISNYDKLQNYLIKHQCYGLSKYNGCYMHKINKTLADNRKNKFVSDINFALILNKTSIYYSKKKKAAEINIGDYHLHQELEKLRI
tara:strand:+ start:1648 stop:2874 length:1227 start_codon:yes stop_codon:yes gene_type:complete